MQNCNRIDGAIPAVEKLLDQGAKVIPCPHLDRPKGEPVSEMGLAPVAPALSERPDVGVKSVDDPRVTGSGTQRVTVELKDGKALLPQNIRYRGEETRLKDGDVANEAYAKGLADLYGGIFINNAFGAAHRVHCSNVGVTGFTKENVVGYLMEKEIKFLGQVVEDPVRPFVAILDGVKVSDKINVINNPLNKTDTLIIGGDMAYTFVKAQSQEIGNSLCGTDKLDHALEMIKKTEEKDVKLLLPVDHVEEKELSNDTKHKMVGVINAGWSGFGIGLKTTTLCGEVLQGAKIVVWDGPMGVPELSNFARGTLEICCAVADLADVITVIGGGDSVNIVKRLGFTDKMTYISTGGDASLGFLKGKELPGVATADNKA